MPKAIPSIRRYRRPWARAGRLGDDTPTWEEVREGVYAPNSGVTIDVDSAGNPVQTVTVTGGAGTPAWMWILGVLAVVAIVWVASD